MKYLLYVLLCLFIIGMPGAYADGRITTPTLFISAYLIFNAYQLIRISYSGGEKIETLRKKMFWWGMILMPAGPYLLYNSFSILITKSYIPIGENAITIRAILSTELYNWIGEKLGYVGVAVLNALAALLLMYITMRLFMRRPNNRLQNDAAPPRA